MLPTSVVADTLHPSRGQIAMTEVIVERAGPMLEITLNRPEKKNALTQAQLLNPPLPLQTTDKQSFLGEAILLLW